MNATNHLAEEWERQPMLKQNNQVIKLFFFSSFLLTSYVVQNGASANNESSAIETLTTENPLSQPSNIIKENSKRQPTPTPFSRLPTDAKPDITNRPTTSGLNPSTDFTQFNYDDHWREIEIDLQRVKHFFLLYIKKKTKFEFI